MPVIYSNNASTTLSAGINNSTTTIGIASASGFPSIGSGEYYFATIANTNNTKIEVVKVTAGTTSLTVTRAQDGTSAQAFDSGDNFQLRVTSATLEAATKTDVNITAGAIAGAAISNDAIDSQHYVDGSIDTAHIGDNQVTAAKVAADVATQAELDTVSTTASAALPKSGGAMTGAITTNSTFDGVDIATRDAVLTTTTTTANAALPKAGGTMTGDLILGDNVKVEVGSASGGDLEIYHDGSHTRMQNNTGNLNIRTGVLSVTNVADNETILSGSANGSVDLYYDNSKKLETDSAGINVTGGIDLTGNIMGVTTIGKDGGDTISFDDNAKTQFHINGNEEMRLEADGDLHVDGDVIAYSTTISDATLKYDINPVEFALDKINQLKGVSYKYKHNDRESAGLLAQDVEKVMPSAVSSKKVPLVTGDGKEYKTLHYDSMTAILVEAIKELTAKVKKLESK